MTNRTKSLRSRRRALRREGAVMLIVMVVLLVSTATAIVAVHGTTFEIRASGHFRQAMQTQYVGETGLMAAFAWVDAVGPQAFLRAMDRLYTAGSSLDLRPFEPSLDPTQRGYRLYEADLARAPTPAPLDGTSLGAFQQSQPQLLVDIYDTHIFTGTVAGQRADGQSPLRFMRATYTSRGRTRLAADVTDAGDFRPRNETASDARARGVSGPFGL